MQRKWIIDFGADRPPLEKVTQPIAVWHAYHKLIVNMTAICQLRGQLEGIGPRDPSLPEQFAVTPGIFLASLVPGVEIGEFDVHHGRLDRIQSEVATDQSVMVLRFRAVRTQDS